MEYATLTLIRGSPISLCFSVKVKTTIARWYLWTKTRSIHPNCDSHSPSLSWISTTPFTSLSTDPLSSKRSESLNQPPTMTPKHIPTRWDGFYEIFRWILAILISVFSTESVVNSSSGHIWQKLNLNCSSLCPWISESNSKRGCLVCHQHA